jgi:hypothetical protein
MAKTPTLGVFTMAATITIADVGPTAITYKFLEAGTAASPTTQDVLANLTANGYGAGNVLFDFLNTSVADANAADALFNQRLDVFVRLRTAVSGNSSYPQFVVAGAVSGSGVGAFRATLGILKNANADTAEAYITIRVRHSIISLP